MQLWFTLRTKSCILRVQQRDQRSVKTLLTTSSGATCYANCMLMLKDCLDERALDSGHALGSVSVDNALLKGAHMQTQREEDFLEYVERKSAATLAVVRTAYDDLHARAHTLATLLAAGSGAMGTLALKNLGDSRHELISWVPLAAVASAWACVAIYVTLEGLSTRRVSAGNGWKNISRYYQDCVGSHGVGAALEMTRREELRVDQGRIEGYIKACDARGSTLDKAYRMIAGSPIVAAIAAALC